MNDKEIARTRAVEAFAQAVHPVLAPLGQHQHTPMGGHEWRWSTDAGPWLLQVGGFLDAGPRVTGPGIDNRWRTAEHTLQHADLVLLMLQLAGGIPHTLNMPVGRIAALAGTDTGGVINVKTYGAVGDPPPRATTREPMPLQLHDSGYRPVPVRLVDTGEQVDVVPVGVAFTLAEGAPPGGYYLTGDVDGEWVHYSLFMGPGAPLTFTGGRGVGALVGARPFSLKEFSAGAPAVAGSDLPARGAGAAVIPDMPRRGRAYAVTEHRPDDPAPGRRFDDPASIVDALPAAGDDVRRPGGLLATGGEPRTGDDPDEPVVPRT